MKTSTLLRLTVLIVFAFATTFTFSQGNHEKIKAKWSVDKFEVEKNTPQAVKAQQELLGTYLTFGNEELVITKKTETGESVIKKGQYTISGNSITLGNDQADILLLSDKSLTIKIPNQGILYLTRM
jgi:hypothetical protein